MYTQRSSSSAQSLKSERKYSSSGQHYDPWQRARILADGREVWIVRQDGDGKKAWYFTDAGEKLAPEDFEWIKQYFFISRTEDKMERTIKVTKCGKEENFSKEDVLALLGIHPDEAYKLKSWWIAQTEDNEADWYLFAIRK